MIIIFHQFIKGSIVTFSVESFNNVSQGFYLAEFPYFVTFRHLFFPQNPDKGFRQANILQINSL